MFHWLLVLAFLFSMSTGLLGDIDLMEWHMISGFCILGLLLFKLLGGIWGRDYSRFTQFSLSPKSVLNYLQGKQHFVGHNPLGSWMIIFMLLMLSVQVLSGLMTTDDFFVEGPWVIWAEDAWISLSSEIHTTLYWALIGMAALHLVAVLYYQLVKKQRLIKAMLTGYKLGLESAQAAKEISWLRLCVLAIVAVSATWFLVNM